MSNGKGDRPRPSSVSREAYAASYARIFRRPMLEDAPAPVKDLAPSSAELLETVKELPA